MKQHVMLGLASVVLMVGLVYGAQKKAATPAEAPYCETPGTGGLDVAAVVAGKPILVKDLDERLGARLARIRADEYDLRMQALNELIEAKLLESEAQKRGITTEQLLDKEVRAKGARVSDDLVEGVYAAYPERFQNIARDQALTQVRTRLQDQRDGQQRKIFLDTLRTAATPKVTLRPYRANISIDDDPSMGPATAQVTIVEFSDFQCPFCSRAGASVKEVVRRYPTQVRLVYRDFPLSIHKDAPKAAEAASCANKQGKFWEMHDMLFANQQALGVDKLKDYARQVGLNGKAFDQCLDSGEFEKEWRHDLADGTLYGVSGTPTFFINGRLLAGAASVERMTAIIDEELHSKNNNSTDKREPRPAATTAAAAQPR